MFSFLACLNPGDEIIVPEPAYANYMAFAISAGAKIRTIATTIEEGFSLPKVEKFEELINERTRAILICNPNNPTGYLYTRREMNQIRDLVKKYDLFLFSDEVYREFIYTGSPYISACHLEGIENNVILITIFSVLFMGILFYYGMDKVLAQLANQKRTFVLNWPEWIFWSFVPIGSACMILHFIEFCLDECTKKEDK